MADLSDPKIDEGTLTYILLIYLIFLTIKKAYQDVRSDKSDTNWLLLDYEVIPPIHCFGCSV